MTALSGVGVSRFLQFSGFSVYVASPVRRARAACPRSSRGAGIQARSLWIAGLLDSRLRGNDDSALLVVKNLLLKGDDSRGIEPDAWALACVERFRKFPLPAGRGLG